MIAPDLGPYTTARGACGIGPVLRRGPLIRGLDKHLGGIRAFENREGGFVFCSSRLGVRAGRRFGSGSHARRAVNCDTSTIPRDGGELRRALTSWSFGVLWTFTPENADLANEARDTEAWTGRGVFRESSLAARQLGRSLCLH